MHVRLSILIFTLSAANLIYYWRYYNHLIELNTDFLMEECLKLD
jgi:hypothetical protein